MNELPKSLFVSGAPLLLAGFNGEYVFCGDKNEPKWKREEHVFVGIPIRSTIIEKNKQGWVLRTDDWAPTSFDSFQTTEDTLPIGSWSGGIIVEAESQPVKEFYRSYGKTIITSVLVASTLCVGARYFFKPIAEPYLGVIGGLLVGASLFVLAIK